MDFPFILKQFSEHHEVADWSSQRRLHACLRHAIQQGILSAGLRLPASRRLAQELNIARNTVVFAYEQLISEGFLLADRRGTMVNPLSAHLAVVTNPVANPTKQMSADFADNSVEQASLARRAQDIMPWPVESDLTSGFAPGVPSLLDFPVAIWRRLLDKTWRNLPRAKLGYASPLGELDLRVAIADYLRASRGVACTAEQVIITDGTQSSLNLCAQAFADTQQKVWIENPGYIGAQIAFRAAQLNIIGIPIDESGIAPSQRDWTLHTPTLIYVTPSHQYPTGGVLTLARRLELIAQAQAHGALIIEDDYDSEFRHDGPPLPAMQGLFPDAPVLYLGTFSKTMFPAMRIAYMIVPKNRIIALKNLISKSHLRGRSADQLCLAQFIQNDYFSQHLRRTRRLYRQRRDTLIALVQTHLPDVVSVHGASAGMHLAIRFLDDTIDDQQVSRSALQQNIVAPALSAHAIGKRKQSWSGLMLGYAQVDSQDMAILVRRLAKIIEQHRNA